jgi:hypothetical protein
LLHGPTKEAIAREREGVSDFGRATALFFCPADFAWSKVGARGGSIAQNVIRRGHDRRERSHSSAAADAMGAEPRLHGVVFTAFGPDGPVIGA